MSDFHHQDWEKLYWERELENERLRERLTDCEFNYEMSRRSYDKMKAAYASFEQQRKTWAGRVEELEKLLEEKE